MDRFSITFLIDESHTSLIASVLESDCTTFGDMDAEYPGFASIGGIMKKNRTMIRILASYLLVTLIPIIVLGTMIADLCNNIIKQEIIRNQQSTLQQLRITFDSMINEMDANAMQMLNSSLFSPTYLQSAYGNYLDVTRHLSSVAFTYSFLSDVCYANSTLSTIYSGQTMYSPDSFNLFGPGYITLNQASGETMTLLIPNKKREWLPFQISGIQNPREILTYIVTNKISDFLPNASVLFQMDRQTLDSIVEEIIPDTHTSFVISDADHTVLYSYPQVLDDGLYDSIQSLPQSFPSREIKANDHDYLVFRAKSNRSPVVYTTVNSYRSVLAPIIAYWDTAVLFLIAISLICFAIIMYSMRVNFAPFKAISHLLFSLFGNAESKQSDMDEFETARKALLHFREEDRLRTKQSITLNLLQGGYASYDAFSQESLAADYALVGPLFRVMTIYINSQSGGLPPDQIMEISSFIENRLLVYTSVSTLCYPEISTIYIVVSDDEENLNNLGLTLKQLQMLISNTYSVVLSIGVGDIVEIEKTSLSASQSSIACQYRFIRGNDSIIFYDEIKNSKGIVSYPFHEIDALYHAILNGNKDRIQFTMNTLIQFITETNSLFYGTCIAYDILNTAIKATQQLNCSVLTVPLTDQTETPRSIDEIITIVNSITDQVVALISQTVTNDDQETRPVSNLEQILLYISNHYADPNFSVKTLADHCQMSTSNLSHYFKKQTGQTVSEYISLLRFDKAKEMLRTSDMTLQSIVPLCGYINLSTLMRQFKLRENCTPANYRARFRG